MQQLDTPAGGEIIARGTLTDWFDTIWDSVLPYASLNNNGLVAFTGRLDPVKAGDGTVLGCERPGATGQCEPFEQR